MTEDGFPREFRCTEPVRPTTTQALLYGESLRGYVLTHLLGGSLWEALQQRPPVVLIKDRELWCVQDQIGAAMALVLLAGDDAKMLELQEPQENADNFVVNLPTNEQAVVYIQADASSDTGTCRDLIGKCSSRMNIYEPFGRVEAVLEALEKRH